ncbi:MAG: response regulator [Thermodesulfovibrionales bacterium]|nr:response regulator [Thermodesulfovibrionales bacterium]
MKRRVLIVDDEPLIRQSLARAIRSGKIEVKECSLGAEAIEEISLRHYDLCFIDVNLPDLSGIDLMKKIKEKSPLTKVVMITACLLDNETENEIEKYSYTFIPKPFDIFQIRKVIKLAFGENAL